jgi:hypothetical protein
VLPKVPEARPLATLVSLNCQNERRADCSQNTRTAFKPLEDVKLTEGTKVEVHVPDEAAPKRRKSVRDLPIFRMWADRDDIPDGVTYEDRIHRSRY